MIIYLIKAVCRLRFTDLHPHDQLHLRPLRQHKLHSRRFLPRRTPGGVPRLRLQPESTQNQQTFRVPKSTSRDIMRCALRHLPCKFFCIPMPSAT